MTQKSRPQAAQEELAQEQNNQAPVDPSAEKIRNVHWWVVAGLQVILLLEMAAAVYSGLWMHVFLILAILSVIFIPVYLGRHLQLHIPSEFHLLAVIFVFASLFLGEIREYYDRLWWWDIALHASSGLLLGILGFVLVYILNENERVNLHMRPRFVAFFAFVFATAVGAIWEIFEFGMDQFFGLNMQKEMLGDPSGLTDTMWDLILDAIGAFLISAIGWWYMVRDESSFIERWIQKLIERNPQLFRGGAG